MPLIDRRKAGLDDAVVLPQVLRVLRSSGLCEITGPRHRHPSHQADPIAIVIYSNVTTEAQSRVYRAFGFAAELLAAGEDVTLVFDGGGSATLAAVLDPGHDLHRSWTRAAPALRGVCSYCARAYGVQDALRTAGIAMVADDRGHASLRALLAEGCQIVTF
jgi:predicted peroxiredoxin